MAADVIQASTERMDGVQILEVEEDLDAATADALYQRGRAAIGHHGRLLLLDLSGLSFCDARGLSALVRMANDAESAGCGFGLIAPKPQVAKILRITALDDRFRVFATIEQAFQDLFTFLAASHAPVSVACGAA